MKLRVDINFRTENDETTYTIFDDLHRDYCLHIETNEKKSIIDLLNDNKLIQKAINERKNMLSYLENSEEELEKITKFENKLTSLIDIIEIVNIDTNDYKEVIEYIELNPILKTKKILLNDYFELEEKNIKKLKEIFKNYSNIYIILKGNTKEQTITECEKTILKIDEIVSHIKKLNLSPFEQMMYTYDLVRDKVYVSEEKDESYTESRDLTRALLGDKIVCTGYANIYGTIINKLGLHCEIYNLESKEAYNEGHAIIVSYIQDEKYNLDGIYYFDPTWDSKKNSTDNTFLNSYRFFAKTKSQMEYYHNYIFQDNNLPKATKDMLKEISDFLEKREIISFAHAMTLNRLSKIIDGGLLKLTAYDPRIPVEFREQIIPFKKVDKELIETKAKEYHMLLNKPIDANIMLKVLYNVRKIEYYENPSKYKISREDFSKIFLNSRWHFQKTKEERLLEVIFGAKQNEKERARQHLENHIETTNLEQEIARIKLTKTLSKIKATKTTKKHL